MIRLAYVATLFAAFALTTEASISQTKTTDLLSLVSTGPSAAELELERRGDADPVTYRLLSERLPSLLLEARDPTSTRLLAKLSGNLRLVNTVPALVNLLTKASTRDMSTTLTRTVELLDDPVGLALAQIGNPSVPEVAKLLQSPNPQIRNRAERVLRKIGSPEAKAFLIEGDRSK